MDPRISTVESTDRHAELRAFQTAVLRSAAEERRMTLYYNQECTVYYVAPAGLNCMADGMLPKGTVYYAEIDGRLSGTVIN